MRAQTGAIIVGATGRRGFAVESALIGPSKPKPVEPTGDPNGSVGGDGGGEAVAAGGADEAINGSRLIGVTRIPPPPSHPGVMGCSSTGGGTSPGGAPAATELTRLLATLPRLAADFSLKNVLSDGSRLSASLTLA